MTQYNFKSHIFTTLFLRCRRKYVIKWRTKISIFKHLLQQNPGCAPIRWCFNQAPRIRGIF